MNVQIKHVKEFDEALVIQLFTRAGIEYPIANRRFFEDEKNVLLVAHINSEPCGFLYGYILDDIRRGRGKLFLYSIDVFNSYQRKGVGTLLMGALMQVAKRCSCHEIFVISNKNNVAAVRLYEKTGGTAEHDDDVVFVYDILR